MDYHEEQGRDYVAAAEHALQWALDTYHPRIAVSTSLQDSILIHMAIKIRPDVRIFSIDTGRLPEETYDCAEQIRRRLGTRIEWYFPRHAAVEKLEADKGLYSFKGSLENRRECCFIRKVELPIGRRSTCVPICRSMGFPTTGCSTGAIPLSAVPAAPDRSNRVRI